MNYTPIPLVVPNPDFNESIVSYQSMELRNAIVSLNPDGVIKVVAYHTNAERRQILEAYRSDFHRNAINDVKSDFYGEFAEVVEALLMRPLEYASQQIARAFGRTSLNVKLMTDLLSTHSNAELNLLKLEYKQRYKRELHDQIHAETSGSLRQLYLNILNGCRNESEPPKDKESISQAKELLTTVETTPEKFEPYFICLISRESYPQLRLIFYNYDRLLPDYKLDRLVELKFRGDLRTAIKAIVGVANSMPGHFAMRLSKAMEGWSTDSNMVMSIIVGRSEYDLGNIKNEYKRIYDRDLVRDIKSDAKGDYKRCLLALIDKK